MFAKQLSGCILVLGLAASGCSNDGGGHPADNLGDTAGERDIEETLEETDSDSDTNIYVNLDCDCESIDETLGYGTSAEHMACALDLCGEPLLGSVVSSLNPMRGGHCSLENMARSMNHFGDIDNDLAPKLGDSYVMLANAPITLGAWGTSVGSDGCEVRLEQVVDSWGGEVGEGRRKIYDSVEFKVDLKAPEDATGFRVRYVFMSVEWDDTLSLHIRQLRNGNKLGWGNDKFYVFKNKVGGSYGSREIINFSDCRFPDLIWWKECEDEKMGCTLGEKICTVSVFSGLSECCWFECDDDNLWTTDLTGTGFECAADSGAETGRTGSSTGWIETQWTVEPGEEFEITFHVHDTTDMYGGSAVLIDSFQFVKNGTKATAPI